ncbi:MAG TPA: SpoIIE family protein phosphatase [Rectinemataceae bacterium]|nr:SpoIIE family protein phosphatase [Rectinemataceae bacterium]
MGKARILIVEDEALSALAIKSYLEDCGFSVGEVLSSGEEAVAAAAETEPDVVLMDIKLDGPIDGVEAAERITKGLRIPVIFLTAYSDSETLRRASLTEPFGYVVKPIDERALSAAIETAIYKASMDRELRATKEKQETILRCVGDGIAVADLHGSVEYLNPAARRLLGFGDSEPLAGVSLFKLFPLSDGKTGESLFLPLQRVVIDGQTVGISDASLAISGGMKTAVDIDLAPLKDDRGSPRGVVMAFRDVSERRKMQAMVSKELLEATDLQMRLLPESGRRIGGLEMRGFLRPATFGAGDIYDFYRIDEKTAAFYILDVVGHGISAAGISVLIHRLLSPDPTLPRRLPIIGADAGDPRQVVDRLNELFDVQKDQTFFSLCYGSIELLSGATRLVRAGHLPPVLQSPDGSLRELHSSGAAVGVMKPSDAVELDFVLGPGERLFLYSDGLIECSDAQSERFSKDRLLGLFEGTRPKPLADAVGRIEAGVAQWRGRTWFDDDLALMAIESGAG